MISLPNTVWGYIGSLGPRGVGRAVSGSLCYREVSLLAFRGALAIPQG